MGFFEMVVYIVAICIVGSVIGRWLRAGLRSSSAFTMSAMAMHCCSG